MLGGIAVHENDMYHLEQRLETMLQAKLPPGYAAIDFELHGAEIKSPTGRKRPSPWAQFDYGLRLDVLRGAYSSIGNYACMDPDYPLALFGAVVDRHYSDYRKRAYEEILHRFDEMLGPTATRQEHWRGVVVHDESNIENNVQAWTQRWREVAGRIPGKLGHVVDVPFFADSKASRMIQAADLVTFALWRYYGLRQPDKTWIDYLWDSFDSIGRMDGLVHVSPAFRTGSCGCPPCRARSAPKAVKQEASNGDQPQLIEPRKA